MLSRCSFREQDPLGRPPEEPVLLLGREEVELILDQADAVGIGVFHNLKWAVAFPHATLGTKRLNAGTALYAANVAASIADGIELAREAIANGKARAKVDDLVRFTQQFKH